VHTRGERFEPRPVRIEPLDSERVLAVAGLESGQRVVVQGAELLHNVR
jgi:membrane fusion protein, heavy metal efflux system